MSSPTDLEITNSLATTPVLTLTGPTALILEAIDDNGDSVLSDSDTAAIYLATPSGYYQPAPEVDWRKSSVLSKKLTALVFEWYGDIKILGSRSGLVVGYVKG